MKEVDQANCMICGIVNAESCSSTKVIWESDSWLLMHDQNPAPIAGWLILLPKRHVQGISGLTEAEAKHFGMMARAVAKGIENTLGVPKVYMIAFGEAVPHMHVHFIPRELDMSEQYFGFGIADLQRKVKAQVELTVSDEITSKTVASLTAYFKACPPL
ncbi:HIT family protein [Litorivicinus sp.]|nr:HIT family protein [Litorivicinus sp.]MDC1239871.1 HIT family protein [Litorivicinus sp.]